jgi:hypothetical protein
MVSVTQTKADEVSKNVVGTLVDRESAMRYCIYRVQKLSRQSRHVIIMIFANQEPINNSRERGKWQSGKWGGVGG